MPNLILGLDSSTQSLSSLLVDLDSGDVLDERSLNFDRDFPQYGTRNGVLPHSDPSVVHSSPLLWADALDRLFLQLKQAKLPLGDIQAVSGSGQQHGSVFLTGLAEKQFREMDLHGSLADNVARVLAKPSSPVWMDTSTSQECAEIREALGGAQAAAAKTGSDITERFTGPQIRKFAIEEPGAFKQTDYILLVSSFLSSLISGGISPIDVGDGAGMNLMDIRSFTWSGEALEATAPDLRKRLPPLCASSTVLGVVNPYLVLKYGLNPSARAVCWTGDNPSSLIGTGLTQPGRIGISLGTSDTLFGAMAECSTDPQAEGHVFGSPAGGYMSMICFRNGSLAREAVKKRFGMDWDGFSQALRDTAPGNGGRLLLPWFEPEIVPRTPGGVQTKGLETDDASGWCRAVVEGQMLSMKLHSRWMGESPDRIHVTGGASQNPDILQIMADVFQVPVRRLELSNGAGLGAVLRAAQAVHPDRSWEDLSAPFLSAPMPDVTPDPATADLYATCEEEYRNFETERLSAL